MKLLNSSCIVLAILLLISCGGKREKMLCKLWQVSDVQFINADATQVQSDTMQGDMLAQRKMILRDVMMKNLYEFKDDGTYITGNASGDAEGEWAFSGDAIKFIANNAEGKKEKLVPIEKLQDDTLIVLLTQDQTTLQLKLILTPVTQ